MKGDGRIDCAVSNAGFQHIEAIETLSLENWRKMVNILSSASRHLTSHTDMCSSRKQMAVHLDGAFLLTKGAFRYMKMEKEGRRGGSILFMGSVCRHFQRVRSLLKFLVGPFQRGLSSQVSVHCRQTRLNGFEP